MAPRRTLVGSGNVPGAVRAGAWYHYCIRTKCSNLLEDLLVHHDASAVALGGLALGALIALLLLLWRRAPRMAAVCGAAPPAALLVLFAGRADRERTSGESHHAIHLHNCWDLARCANGFSVYVHHVVNPSRQHNTRPRRSTPIWWPPTGVHIASSPEEACVVVVPLSEVALRPNNDGVPQLTGWRGGRNHVVVDDSDEGVDFAERRYGSGSALVAQSHMELANYVPDFDISLPLSLPSAVRSAALPLAALEYIGRSRSRRHWLTFKGSLYVDEGEGSQRAALFALASSSNAGGGRAGSAWEEKRVEVFQNCHKASRTASAQTRNLCERLAREFNSAPTYADLLNTTFALVPAGRQPASYRLAEVMAAGAIPVFVSGDRLTSSPYVRPFGEVIDWSSISLHFSWADVPAIPQTLRRLSAKQVLAMRRGVQLAWRSYMHPHAASQTFYGLLERRASSRFRRA